MVAARSSGATASCSSHSWKAARNVSNGPTCSRSAASFAVTVAGLPAMTVQQADHVDVAAS
jgi:hypothetical protein